MAHQTGITASEGLATVIANSKEGDFRLLKIGITDEQLVLQHSAPCVGTWEDDYDRLVLPLLEPKQPCYILYRLDTSNDSGHEWIFITYVPDNSLVKQKMLYAATRATMKREFGVTHIFEEMHGTVPEDVGLNGYKKHLESQKAPPPLTNAEEELQIIHEGDGSKNHIHVDTKQQTLTGVMFPITSEAMDSLHQLKDGSVNYVQLSVDISAETINLECCESLEVSSLVSRIPLDHARYHLYNYKHTHEGDYTESVIFIYSMPGYKCSIKERMMYSSCKNPLMSAIEESVGIPIARKVEVDDPKEVSEEYIYDEIHPKKNVGRTAFAKPKGPAGRAPKRMPKANGND